MIIQGVAVSRKGEKMAEWMQKGMIFSSLVFVSLHMMLTFTFFFYQAILLNDPDSLTFLPDIQGTLVRPYWNVCISLLGWDVGGRITLTTSIDDKIANKGMFCLDLVCVCEMMVIVGFKVT
jgi:hypothetical protein